MYYKVIKDNKVIDVLDHLTYLKWQKKNKIMLLSDLNEAQAILASDGNTVWHVEGLYDLPIDGYDTVELVEIDEYEYRQLKMLNGRSIQDILDEYTLLLIEEGVI
jgi:hypothetical protein